MSAIDLASEERLERECIRFLHNEAELLDNREFRAWLETLSPEIDYRVPVRTTRENKDGDGFSTTAFFLEEDFDSLKARAVRLQSDYAWSENPATRTRRLVTNVRVKPVDGDATGRERIGIYSNMAVYCYRGDRATPVELTCERRDVLRQLSGTWKLARRLVRLDATVLGMESLSIFL